MRTIFVNFFTKCESVNFFNYILDANRNNIWRMSMFFVVVSFKRMRSANIINFDRDEQKKKWTKNVVNSFDANDVINTHLLE